MPTNDGDGETPTYREAVQYIVDDRASGAGWQPIADSLNAVGLRDADGARWSAKRVRRAYDAQPDKTPSFCRATAPPTSNILTDLMRPHDRADLLRPLPETVVGRRRLWHWVKGTKA